MRLVGSLDGGSTLSGEVGFPYVLEALWGHLGSVHVKPGAGLTVEPGAVFKAFGSASWNGYGTGLEIGGGR